MLLGNGDGTFQPPLTFSGFDFLLPETSVAVLAVGDFNGDRKPDMVVSGGNLSLGPYQAAVAFGNGDGTFQTPSIFYTNAINPISVISAGDVNGDGKTDLVVGTGDGYDSATVNVLLGHGDGTFQAGETIGNLSCYAPGMAIGDVNGDGKADLVVLGGLALLQDGMVGIFLGNGDGTFRAPINYGGSGFATNIAIVDFNGDGKPDLAYGDDYVSVLLGNGDGTFQPVVNYPGVSSSSFELAVPDFNGDGRADIADVGPGAVDILVSAPFLATSTELSSTPNPSISGQYVSLTAQVSPPTATGTVKFYDGPTLLGTGTVSAGIATYSTSIFLGGMHLLTAVYGGDTFDAPSTSSVLIQTVDPAPTSVTLTSSPNPSIFRGVVQLTAGVSPGSATGTVMFYKGSTLLGTGIVSSGIAILNISNLPVGAHSLTAAYSGDASDQPSTSPSHTQIVKDSSSITLTSSANPSKAGQSVLFTASVIPAGATGQVTFYAGSTVIGTKTLSGGKAVLSESALPAGKHEISASYAGDASHGPSASPVLIQVVK